MFRQFISEFEDNIQGLREFVELINPILEEHQKKVEQENTIKLEPISLAIQKHMEEDFDKKEVLDKRFKEVFDGDIKVEIDEEKNISFSIKGDTTSIDEAFKRMGKTQLQIEQLYKSSLMSLLSSVEWFFSQILHHHYDSHPNSAGINKKAITLDDLKSFDSIKDAENYLIDQKIESVLRSSFSDWKKVLKDEIGLKISYLDDYEDELIEIYQRRNLMVHNGGIINSIYMSKITDKLSKGKKIGDKLQVSKEYLEDAIDKLHLIFILITSELWKKIEPENEHRGKYIMILGYDYLVKNNWRISKTANQFLSFDKKMPIANRTAAQLNIWLCDKEKDGFEVLEKQIKDVDYSDKSLLFQVGLAALKRENDFCIKNLPHLLKSEDLDPEEILEFPILKEVRECEKFNDFIKSDEIMIEYLKSN
jgi:hypothetical protein